jgi:phage shock protein B
MQAILIIAVIVGGSLLALAIIGGTILMGIKMLRGGFSRKGQRAESEETRMIQEIYRGLSRMEQRVEALETLIFDRTRKDDEAS